MSHRIFRFGEQNESRIIRYLVENCEKEAAIVDVGCGNGHLLIELVCIRAGLGNR